jgi:hypothetical protein
MKIVTQIASSASGLTLGGIVIPRILTISGKRPAKIGVGFAIWKSDIRVDYYCIPVRAREFLATRA